MPPGFLFALGACFVWGLIFVIPSFLGDFTPLEVAFGRYSSYGILSICLLFREGWGVITKVSLKVWGTALLFGLISNVLYYIGVIMALRYATAPVTVLILGLCPILVAVYGNFHTKEFSFRKLFFPCIWMLSGLVLVNISEIDWTFTDYSAGGYLIGLGSVCTSLAFWTWYAVKNANFLKNHTEIPRSIWATLLGVGTFMWVLIGLVLCKLGGSKNLLDFSKFSQFSPELSNYVIGVVVLGVICSWLGCYLWNKASSLLPYTLMGPLIIFETLFGLFFVYLCEKRLPSIIEFLGILSMLGGIFLAIYLFRQSSKEEMTESTSSSLEQPILDKEFESMEG